MLDGAPEVDLALLALAHELPELLLELRILRPAHGAIGRILKGLDRQVDLAVVLDRDDLGLHAVVLAEVVADIEIGAVVEGTVQRITPYGAFIQIDDGPVGLIHVSQIDRNYVREVRDHLRENDRVQAKVVSIKDDGKIDLSIKALQEPERRPLRRGSDPEFEQKLRRFMRQSEERQVDYRRAIDHKRR